MMKQLARLFDRLPQAQDLWGDGCSGLRLWRPTSRLIAGLLLVASLAPSGARSQELSGSMTLYGWLPWLDAEVTPKSGGGSAKTSVSSGAILDALEFAFMAAGEVHYGRIGILHDTIYAELDTGGNLSGPFSSKVDVDTKMLLATTALGYQVYAEDGWLIEPYAGARYVDIETDVTIKGDRSAPSRPGWAPPIS